MTVNNPFEKEIKAAIINHLLYKKIITTQSIIINEFTIDSFSRRADLVIINNNEIIAYEIKSDADSLSRLAGQIDKYRFYFDKTIIVTTPKHIDKLSCNYQKDVGLWEFSKKEIKVIKKGTKSSSVSKEKYLDLLKVLELKKLAKHFSLKISSVNKLDIKKEISLKIKRISHMLIKKYVLELISSKYRLNSDYFINIITKKGYANDYDIELLRQYVKKYKIETREFWYQNSPPSQDAYLEELAKQCTQPLFGEVPECIEKLINN